MATTSSQHPTFFTGWTPDEQMRERLSGDTTSLVSMIERGIVACTHD